MSNGSDACVLKNGDRVRLTYERMNSVGEVFGASPDGLSGFVDYGIGPHDQVLRVGDQWRRLVQGQWRDIQLTIEPRLP